ncbi:MAG: SCP2 sterol-binding domain-containing protein [Deltaproteobacteria bacterium]
MAGATLTAPFEALLNRQIEASTPARELLASLAGRAFAIEIEGARGYPLLRLRLAADAGQLTVSHGEGAADATVRGTPFGLAALVAGRAEGRTTASGVTIDGDAEVASGFEKLLGHARPDLEAELARLVGELPAHYAARAVRDVTDWGRRAARSLLRSSSEYLTEEGRDLVPRAELDAFLGDVDGIREDVDRAEARLQLIEARLGRKAS